MGGSSQKAASASTYPPFGAAAKPPATEPKKGDAAGYPPMTGSSTSTASATASSYPPFGSSTKPSTEAKKGGTSAYPPMSGSNQKAASASSSPPFGFSTKPSTEAKKGDAAGYPPMPGSSTSTASATASSYLPFGSSTKPSTEAKKGGSTAYPPIGGSSQKTASASTYPPFGSSTKPSQEAKKGGTRAYPPMGGSSQKATSASNYPPFGATAKPPAAEFKKGSDATYPPMPGSVPSSTSSSYPPFGSAKSMQPDLTHRDVSIQGVGSASTTLVRLESDASKQFDALAKRMQRTVDQLQSHSLPSEPEDGEIQALLSTAQSCIAASSSSLVHITETKEASIQLATENTAIARTIDKSSRLVNHLSSRNTQESSYLSQPLDRETEERRRNLIAQAMTVTRSMEVLRSRIHLSHTLSSADADKGMLSTANALYKGCIALQRRLESLEQQVNVLYDNTTRHKQSSIIPFKRTPQNGKQEKMWRLKSREPDQRMVHVNVGVNYIASSSVASETKLLNRQWRKPVSAMPTPNRLTYPGFTPRFQEHRRGWDSEVAPSTASQQEAQKLSFSIPSKLNEAASDQLANQALAQFGFSTSDLRQDVEPAVPTTVSQLSSTHSGKASGDHLEPKRTDAAISTPPRPKLTSKFSSGIGLSSLGEMGGSLEETPKTTSGAPSRPNDAPPDYKKLLSDIYQVHKPERVNDVPKLLEKYKVRALYTEQNDFSHLLGERRRGFCQDCCQIQNQESLAGVETVYCDYNATTH